MASSQSQPTVPPEVARYLDGPPAESHQFDFLVGEWDVDATRFKDDGSPLFKYRARWTAGQLNGGRMLMDDFRSLGSDGQPVSSYITLRTYSKVTGRWEMTGLQALEPAGHSEWHGVSSGGEMLVRASGTDRAGHSIHTTIRFFAISTNSFRWESSTSRDGGTTWTRSAAMLASRALAAGAS